MRSGSQRDRASALDLLMAVQGEAGTKNIAIDKKLIADVFFRLSTGLAGEILKNYVNYGGRITIYGDLRTHRQAAEGLYL